MKRKVNNNNTGQKLFAEYLKAIDNISYFQSGIQSLKQYYKTSNFDDFAETMFNILFNIFVEDMKQKKTDQHNAIMFTAQLCAELQVEYERNYVDTDSIIENEDEPLLKHLVTLFLENKFIWSDNISLRYNICKFFSNLLKEVGRHACLGTELCEQMQQSLIDKLDDPSSIVRTEVVKALAKLQEPNISNGNCPCMIALVEQYDDSPMVRKEIIAVLAITKLSIFNVFIPYTQDVDHSVRMAAYQKLQKVPINQLNIASRRQIVLIGIAEKNKQVKTSFKKLMSTILEEVENDLIKLFNMLRLDADEKDLKETEEIYESLTKIYFSLLPSETMIKFLPLDERKVVLIDKINIELSSYWYNCIKFLKSDERYLDLVDNVLVDVPTFCEYVRSYMKENRSCSGNDQIIYQQVLYNLFRLAALFDVSEQTCNKLLKQLAIEVLETEQLNKNVVFEVLGVLQIIINNVAVQWKEVQTLINKLIDPDANDDLTGPETDSTLTDDQKRAIAELERERHEKNELRQNAVDMQKFTTAEQYDREARAIEERIAKIRREAEAEAKTSALETDGDAEQLRIDEGTAVRCLTILKVFFDRTKLNSQTAKAAMGCLREFVLPSAEFIGPKYYSLVLDIVGSLALFDRNLAREKMGMICAMLPLQPNFVRDDAYEKCMYSSMMAVTNIVIAHGPGVLENFDNANGQPEDVSNATALTNGNTTSLTGKATNKSRRLYNSIGCTTLLNEMMNEQPESSASSSDSQLKLSGGAIMGMFLNLLDDANDNVRHFAVKCTALLVVRGLLVEHTLMSRLLLKWINPLTVKEDPYTAQFLAKAIIDYVRNVRGSSAVIEKSVVPVLCTISKAPKTSPLHTVNVESCLKVLSELTRINRPEYCNVHKNIIYNILSTLKRKANCGYAHLLTRMLLLLDLPQYDYDKVFKDYNNEINVILMSLCDARALRNIGKFSEKLMQPPERRNKENLQPIDEIDEDGENASNTSKKESTRKGRKKNK